MCKSAYPSYLSLYVLYNGVGSSVPSGGCNCNCFDCFFSLYLILALLLRQKCSTLICSRNEDGEFQREFSSSADACRPTPELPRCSLVLSLLLSLSLFLSYALLPYRKLSFLILVCLSLLSVSSLPPSPHRRCHFLILHPSLLLSLPSVPWQICRVSVVCLAVLMSAPGHGWWRNKHL